MRMSLTAAALGVFVTISVPPAGAEPATSAVTAFDTKQCQHKRGGDVEDYGSWRCRGFGGQAVYITGGDQRMAVSFGPNAAREIAVRQTFPAFNNVYPGQVEWRLSSDGKPFATILAWSVRLESDDRESTGRVLVVTRLGPGGVCHVGYVDARANADAGALARQVADERARQFECGKDDAVVLGKVSAGLSMPDSK